MQDPPDLLGKSVRFGCEALFGRWQEQAWSYS